LKVAGFRLQVIKPEDLVTGYAAYQNSASRPKGLRKTAVVEKPLTFNPRWAI
jgi:hypothetical protein